jgi:hypothetical protein
LLTNVSRRSSTISTKQILKKNIKDPNQSNEASKLVSSESFATFEQQQQQHQLNQNEQESGKKSIAESYKTVRKIFDKVAAHDDKSERSNHLDAENLNLNEDKSVAKSTSNYKINERNRNRLSFKAIGK